MPPNLYSNKEVNDLISKVTLATSKNIENILDEVVEIATTKNNKSLLNRINNILNGNYETTVSGRKKAIKIDLDTRKRLEAIIKTRLPDTATDEQISERNKTLNEEFEKFEKYLSKQNQKKQPTKKPNPDSIKAFESGAQSGYALNPQFTIGK